MLNAQLPTLSCFLLDSGTRKNKLSGLPIASFRHVQHGF